MPEGDPLLDTKERRLCFKCVEDEFLRANIERDGHDRTCFYCEQHGETFSIDQIADFVYTALSECFDRPTQFPPDIQAELDQMARDSGEEPADKGRRVGDVIRDEVGVCEAAAEDIRRVLAERHEDAEHG